MCIKVLTKNDGGKLFLNKDDFFLWECFEKKLCEKFGVLWYFKGIGYE